MCDGRLACCRGVTSGRDGIASLVPRIGAHIPVDTGGFDSHSGDVSGGHARQRTAEAAMQAQTSVAATGSPGDEALNGAQETWPGLVVLAALLVVLAVVVIRALVRAVTIFDHQRGVLYRRGRLSRVLEPGRHVLMRRGSHVSVLDVRERVVTVAGQEVLTSDGVPVRLSVLLMYAIARPEVALSATASFDQSLYALAQLAVRDIVAGLTSDDLFEQRATFGPRALEVLREPAAGLGLDLRAADVKDVMLPGELKRLFAQVVIARKEGQAALERARGETAALRNLANAAQLMRNNPELFQLRLMQVVESSTGNTVVIGSGAGVLAPLAAAGPEPEPPLPRSAT